MPPKRKRGTAKCLKMIKDPKDFKIEFDSNGLAIGENAAFFMSWVGKAFRKKIPYYQLVKDIDKQLYNDVWVSLKKSSQKAKISAGKNIDPARVGRGGFLGLDKVWEDRWIQLVLRYLHLAHMEDRRSRIYTVSRAICNLVTKLFELGPHKAY
ncbi:hypothetical protein L1987_87651 [Smallanthus sonchifolius]|nr:hypothetical protein L1987_87651 [Smallanthus sonchifolius]